MKIKERFSSKEKEKIKDYLRDIIYYSWKFLSFFKKKGDFSETSKILVIHRGKIGDLLVTFPMIRALSKKYEKVDILIDKNQKETVSGNPFVSKILFYEDFEKVLEEIKNRYDLAVIFWPGNFEMIRLCHKAGIKYIVGNSFSYSLSDIFLNKRCRNNPKQHFVQRALDQARFIGADTVDSKLKFYLTKKSEKNIASLLEKKGVRDFVVFHSGKRGVKFEKYFWPSENWAEVADYLAKKHSLSVILTGSKLESERNREIMMHVKSGKVFNLCEKTDIKELGSLIKKSKMIISLVY